MFERPSKMVKEIEFKILSPEEILKLSAVKITVPDTYELGYPIEGGLADLRLGTVDPGLRCKTCGNDVRHCPGHFGHIELVRPVIHPGYAKLVYYALKKTCPYCKKVVGKGKTLKQIEREEKSEKRICPHCGKELPTIKFEKPTSFFKDGEEMSPLEIKEWLDSLPEETVRELGFDPEKNHPAWGVLTYLLVPSVKIRPSIILETGEISEDDLTHKLVDIIRINQKLASNIEAGAPQIIIEDLWKLLQYHVTTYFNNETPNIPPAKHRSGRPLKTLAQRLKGKEGRFRYNLSGKRVNFSARTVISPDPMISINEVGVPEYVAKKLTLPVRVTEWNKETIREMILKDENDYPRVLYVIREDGRKIKVLPGNKEQLANELKVGWIVERQMMDGDIVLFNRQPSLHRISMMGHLVKVLPGKTFRINPTVTPPYNADFDGDEMNLHLLQDPEAQAEARILMQVEYQILSPRHGHAIIKPTEDYVSGIYLLTKDAVLTREEAARLLYIAGITELPEPDIRGKYYSGKLIFSMLLPKDLNIKVKSKLGEEIVIKNGKLIKGAIESNAIESALIEHFVLNYGFERAKKFLDDVTKIAVEYLTLRGLSVSLRNYKLSEKAKKKIKEMLDKMNREINNYILKYKNKTLEILPGMSMKETLDELIMKLTSKTRDEIGKVVEEDLGKENSSIIMAKIGARGSLLNAIQMAACVAQQAVRNKRPNRGYSNRNLPVLKPNLIGAREKGFVFSCFVDGLEPDEFFHHGMGGRESIVNTAIRTARSGYMYRRLSNAMQDLLVWDDFSVRYPNGVIAQFIYGGDGVDPMFSKTKEFTVEARQDDVDTV